MGKSPGGEDTRSLDLNRPWAPCAPRSCSDCSGLAGTCRSSGIRAGSVRPLSVYLLFLTGQSLILTYGTNLAGFGIVTPIAMHAMFNTVSRFLPGLFADTQPSGRVPFELVMALCGLATGLGLAVATRGRLAYREGTAQGFGGTNDPRQALHDKAD